MSPDTNKERPIYPPCLDNGLRVKIIEETTFRSRPMVNMSDDMAKVGLILSRNDWRLLKEEVDKINKLCRIITSVTS